MRKLSLFLMVSLFSLGSYAQSYTQLWQKVDSLMAIKNFKQSGEVLLHIRNKAVAEHNIPEKVRTTLAVHNSLTVNQTNTDRFNTINNHFQTQLSEAHGVEINLLASFYAQFLLSNISLQKVGTNNFHSLPNEERVQIIDSLFSISIADKEALAKEPLAKWNTLLTHPNKAIVTPTVYHLLALNYLDFLLVDKSKDSLAKALINEIQDLNKRYKYADAAAYLTYRPFIYGPLSIANQADTLSQLLTTTPSDFNAHIYYLLAKANNPREALPLLKIAKEKYPMSPWINNVDTLFEQLTKSRIQIKLPSFVPSQQHTPLQIKHKNTAQLYIRIYDSSTKSKTVKNIKTNYDSLGHKVSIAAPLVYEEILHLKKFDDPDDHSTLYKLNPLPYGRYQILVSNNPDFKDDGIYLETISSHFYVSDLFISAYEKEIVDETIHYSMLLINRKSGKPYAKKTIELTVKEESKPQLKKIKQYKTSAAGEFSFKLNSTVVDINDVWLFAADENQWISVDEIFNIPELLKEEISTHKTNDEQSIIMTDRNIYRPGQPIEFKAILYTNNFKNGKIIPHQTITIRLKDANDQEIQSQQLTTNTFGSVHGTFMLPTQLLNGNFRIELLFNKDRLHTKNIKVEEYKRPSYKVTFEPNKNTYSKADTAVFIGKVESLTAVPISNSIVSYSITTSSYSPYFDDKIESTTTSDEQGNFRITIPLMDTIYSDYKSFRIAIQAQVKSPTEEIQKASTSYQYRDHPKVLTVDVNYKQEAFTWKTIAVKTTNSNGFPLPFAGTINIYKLEQLTLPLGDNALNFNQEYDLLNTAEYQKYFPNLYDKALQQKEQNKSLIASYPFDTNISSTITIDSTLFDYGKYLIEGLSIGRDKDTARTKEQVVLYQKNNGKFTDNTFLTYAFDKDNYTDQDTARLTFYSDLKDVKNIFLWKIKGTEIEPASIVPFVGDKATYEFRVSSATELPKTDFDVLLVKDNKIKRITIQIPYKQQSKKNINILTKTFRDKITPGTKEKWSFTVTQNDTQAEILATLYDSALDQFSSNTFNQYFYLSYPYFNRHRLYHIAEEFEENAYWNNFMTVKGKSFKPFTIPQIRNYELWSKSIFPYASLIILKDKEGNNLMEEVVVKGFGAQKKMIMTGAVSNVENMLQGRVSGVTVDQSNMPAAAGAPILIRGMSTISQNSNDPIIYLYDALKDPGLEAELVHLKNKIEQDNLLNSIKARTNLKETAFFYPELYTDDQGNITFEFDTPEALTKWKLLLFAHTKDLQSGNATYYTHTQKQLMVQPNIPRFMRVGDQITIKSMVNNLSSENISGVARLQLIDPETNAIIQDIFASDSETKPFTIAAQSNTTLSWMINAPAGYPTVLVKVIAATDTFSDGEQHELTIIPNEILITETQKISIQKNQHQDFTINSGGKNNLQAQVIIQANPILEILSSLEYLNSYPYECAEQIASKWFGIKTIQYIHKYYPAITTYFNTLDTANITSSLREKMRTNELLLTEMPWLKNTLNEEAKLKLLASLFNTKNIERDLQQLEEKLQKLQKNDGSFAWFDGGNSNLYISTRVLEVFGKIHHLDSTLISKDTQKIIVKLKSYLSQDKLFDLSTSYSQPIDYAYALQYWQEDVVPTKTQKAWLLKALQQAPITSAKQAAGIAAKSWIVADRYGLQIEANAIFNRLDQEYSIDSLAGMYWKSNGSYYNSVSLHTYLIEAYLRLKPQFVKDMADWLFYQKTHNNWRTTWMSADAIYALLLANNPEAFSVDNKVTVSVNDKNIKPTSTAIGQISQNFNTEDLRVDKVLKINNNNERKIYGSIIHQYFLPLEQVTSSAKDIAVTKHVLVFRDHKWIASNRIISGEKVKIRLEVISNKNLTYVHIKDSRAAGFEPEYRPSGYQFRNHGYYFTNKDASTNYFIDYLPKGSHMFEYEVKTNNVGTFNAGISQIECMYDPTVNARSENLKIEIKE